MEKRKIKFHASVMEAPVNKGWLMIPYRNVMYLVYGHPYTELVYIDNAIRKKILLQAPLQLFEAHLPACFFRTSRVAVVNMEKIKGHTGYEIEMIDGNVFPVSRRRKSLFNMKTNEL